jgi:hypothetical protein
MKVPELLGTLFLSSHIGVNQLWGEGIAEKLSLGQRYVPLSFIYSFNKYLLNNCLLVTVLALGTHW